MCSHIVMSICPRQASVPCRRVWEGVLPQGCTASMQDWAQQAWTCHQEETTQHTANPLRPFQTAHSLLSWLASWMSRGVGRMLTCPWLSPRWQQCIATHTHPDPLLLILFLIACPKGLWWNVHHIMALHSFALVIVCCWAGVWATAWHCASFTLVLACCWQGCGLRPSSAFAA